ncbi:MAG: hypothetical protein ACX94C_05895 [Phycisphaerales bacterium]
MTNPWIPVVNADQLHPHFEHLRKERGRDCDVISSWLNEFDDADNKIVKELQSSFNPALWELYLDQFFRQMAFEVQRPKDHPDFTVSLNGVTQFACEAKVTLASPGDNPEDTGPLSEIYDPETFYDKAALKLSGALFTKINDFRQYAVEAGIEGHPFLLAVTPFDNPHFTVQHARSPWRVLYQYDRPITDIAPDGSVYESGYTRIQTITKENGEEISMGYFREGSNPDISAVYFNPRATLSKTLCDQSRVHHPDELVHVAWADNDNGVVRYSEVHPSSHNEKYGDGGYLFLNPAASYQIDPGPFYDNGVTVYTFSETLDMLVSRTPNPFLFSRVFRCILDD